MCVNDPSMPYVVNLGRVGLYVWLRVVFEGRQKGPSKSVMPQLDSLKAYFYMSYFISFISPTKHSEQQTLMPAMGLVFDRECLSVCMLPCRDYWCGGPTWYGGFRHKPYCMWGTLQFKAWAVNT